MRRKYLPVFPNFPKCRSGSTPEFVVIPIHFTLRLGAPIYVLGRWTCLVCTVSPVCDWIDLHGLMMMIYGLIFMSIMIGICCY